MAVSGLNVRLENGIRFFLYVLAFWLPYSPAVVEVCVIVSIILWIIKRVVSMDLNKFLNSSLRLKILYIFESFRMPRSPINQPAAWFVLIAFLSVFGSVFFLDSLSNFVTKTLEWFAIYFLVLETFTARKHFIILFMVMMVTAFSTALDSFYQYYVSYKDIFLGHKILPGGRATAAFTTPNGLAAFLSLLIPVFLGGVAFSGKDFFRKAMYFLFIMSMLWALLITQSRGGWAGLILGGGLGMAALFFFKKKRIHFLLRVL